MNYSIFSLMAGMALVSSALPVAAQSLRGMVTDEAGKPVPYANVVLLSLPDSAYVSGCISGLDGSFSLERKGLSSGLVKATCIGYSPCLSIFPGADPLVLKMAQDAHSLQGVTVKGALPQIVRKGSTLMVNVSGTTLSKLGTANDVLTHIPGVIKRNDELEVIGKDAPLIYIDGHKLRNKNELERLSAENIRDVELITNPGPEYDASVNAVLKIRTVRKEADNLGVAYTQMFKQEKKSSHAEQLDLNYKHKGFNLFGNVSYSSYNFRQKQHNDYKVSNEAPLLLNEDLRINTVYKDISGMVGFNEDINKNHSFGATYSIDKPTEYKGGWEASIDVKKGGKPVSLLNNILDNNYLQSPIHTVNTYYNGKWGKVSFDWNGTLYLNKSDNENHSREEDYLNGTKRSVNSSYENDSRLYATNFSLRFPLWKGTFSVGSEYTNTVRKNTYTIEGNGNDLPQDNDDKVNEQNAAGFASYSLKLGKVRLNGGVRFEHVEFDYYNKGVYVASQSRRYNTLFPSLSLSAPVKGVNVSLSYTAKARRPSYIMLSGDVQYNDRYTYQSGNVLLQPTTIHDIDLNLSYKWVQFDADWQYRKNAFYQCVVPYDGNPDITVFAYRNLPHYSRLYVSLLLSPKIGIWQPQLSAAILKPFTKVNERGYERKYTTPVGLFSFNNALSLPSGFLLRMDFSYTTSGNDGSVIYYKPTGYMNVALYKSFFHDRLSFNLQGNDLFDTTRNSTRLIYGNRDFNIWNNPCARSVTLTIKYRFNTLDNNYKGTGAGNSEKRRL